MDKVTQLQQQIQNLAYYMTEPLYAINLKSPAVMGEGIFKDENSFNNMKDFQENVLANLAQNLLETSNNVKQLIDAMPDEFTNEQLDENLENLDKEYEGSVVQLSDKVILAEKMLEKVKNISNSLTSTALHCEKK